LGGGDAGHKRVPYASWGTICTPRKQGGLGVKNFNLWNIASIAKLVWPLQRKKTTYGSIGFMGGTLER